jgi:hypothetical protein
MEGELCDGRTNAVCDPAQGRRDDGFAVSGVRNLAQPAPRCRCLVGNCREQSQFGPAMGERQSAAARKAPLVPEPISEMPKRCFVLPFITAECIVLS